MKEIALMFKKEAKDFFVRKSMLGRYAVILFLNLLMAVYPAQPGNTLFSNTPLLSFCCMLLTTYIVLGFLCVDVIGSEKAHKTYETLLSTPLKVSNIFYGITLFVFTIGFAFILLATVINNTWLHFIFQKSYFDVTGSAGQLAILYVSLILSILLMVFVGLILSLFSKNYKINRYVMLALSIGIIYAFYLLIQHDTINMSLVFMTVFVVLLALLFITIKKHMSKQYALKYAK